MDFLFNTGTLIPSYESNNCILFNADCRNILNKFDDESIDLFCSDIPYKIAKKGGGGIKKERKKIYGSVCLIVLIIQKKI